MRKEKHTTQTAIHKLIQKQEKENTHVHQQNSIMFLTTDAEMVKDAWMFIEGESKYNPM